MRRSTDRTTGPRRPALPGPWRRSPRRPRRTRPRHRGRRHGRPSKDGEVVEPVRSVAHTVFLDVELDVAERCERGGVQAAAGVEILDHEQDMVHDDAPDRHPSLVTPPPLASLRIVAPASCEWEGNVTTIVEAENLADLYELPPLEWEAVTSRLDEGLTQAPGKGGPDHHTCWLATIDPDGSPHVTGVGALWAEETFWFETGDRTRKGRNLARDPRCTLSVATREFDLVVQGDVHRVTDPQTVAAMAARWAAGGWPCRVDETGQALTADYSAPSAGPPPWF